MTTFHTAWGIQRPGAELLLDSAKTACPATHAILSLLATACDPDQVLTKQAAFRVVLPHLAHAMIRLHFGTAIVENGLLPGHLEGVLTPVKALTVEGRPPDAPNQGGPQNDDQNV